MKTPLMYEELLVWGAWHRWWYAPFFLLALIALWFGYVTYKRRLSLLVHFSHLRSLLPGYAPWKGRAKAWLQSLAVIALFVALLQPQWGRKEVQVQQEGRDVLIALDISRSMQAQDVKPNRLTFVKTKIRKLLNTLSFDRVGLILFSGSAFVQCPLTADYHTFLMFLDTVTTESISSGTTAIGTAIDKAIELFKRSQNRKNKVVLLITDGEDFASDQKKIADRIAREHLTVLSWGVGTSEGAPIPLFDARGSAQGHAKDAQGNVALSKLNEPLLQKLSRDLGGQYERVTQDDGDIARLVQILAQFEKEQFDERTMSEYHDQYPWFLGVTFLALLFEWLL